MDILKFAEIVGKLKKVKRTGWVRKHIPSPESVAEHSFRVAVLASVIAPKLGLDQAKAVQMALFHDLGEAEVGDIVTHNGKQTLPNYEEKINQERAGLKKVLSHINGTEYLKLFDEFEENKTPVAKLIKDLDKLEMAIQALEYEQEYKINLQTFFESSQTLIKGKKMASLLEAIKKLRPETNRNE